MNQLTTIASLPSGSGCKSALPAEVWKRVEPKSGEWVVRIRPGQLREEWRAGSFYPSVPLPATVTHSYLSDRVPTTTEVVQNFTVGDVATIEQVRQAVAASVRRNMKYGGEPI